MIKKDDLAHHDEALKAFDKAIEIKPDNPEAWNKKGIALINLGRHAEALETFNKAIEIKPDYTEAWYKKGIALINLNSPDEAKESFNEAIKIKPDYPEILYKTVIFDMVVFFRLYQYDKAFEAYNFAYHGEMEKSTFLLHIGIDGRWSVYEMSQMLSAIEDLYNFIIATSIGEKFPPLKRYVKEALEIGELRLEEEKVSEFFRTITRSTEGLELTIKNIQYGSPGFINIRGNGKGIKVIFDFLKWFIVYFSPTSIKKRKLELEETRSKFNSDNRIRELDIKDKQSKMIWEFLDQAKANGYPDSDLKALLPYIYEKTNPLIESVERGKLVSVDQESDIRY